MEMGGDGAMMERVMERGETAVGNLGSGSRMM